MKTITPKAVLFKSGDPIFKESDPATSLYLVKSGRVSIRKQAEKGAIEIAQVGVNQIFGEMAFFDRMPRSADAMAATDVELIEIPFESLDPVYDPAPPYLKKMMASMASRLRDADEMIRELKERLGGGDTKGYVTEEGDEISDLDMALIMTAEPEKK